MDWNLMFFVNSLLLGLGLAMDAFSVSLANGLNEPQMSRAKTCGIAGVFAFFQALMPMIGWVCVHTIAQRFAVFEKCVPWIALVLLCAIGTKMIVEYAKEARASKTAKTEDGEQKTASRKRVGIVNLLVQGVATSIDALSVGFTIADYNLPNALVCAAIIAAVTFVLCTVGVILGKKFGTRFAGKATLAGGIILIAIGLEIFITGIV